MSELEEWIARIRAGDASIDDVRVFTDGGKLSTTAAALFREGLANGSELERSAIVHALETIGQRLDPLYERGSTVLRDSGVIALLVDPGLATAGPARTTAIEILLGCVPPQSLYAFGPKLTADFKAHTDDSALHLIAKAKPADARIEVARLMSMPRWGPSDSVRIAHAAFGHAETEKEFIQGFLETRDPAEKARLARALGYIGTQNALKALAREMRTDLVAEIPNVLRRSVRLDIIAALRITFPDKPVLWDNSIMSDEGYARVEEFCFQKFGTQWRNPRPPFLWIEGFPVR